MIDEKKHWPKALTHKVPWKRKRETFYYRPRITWSWLKERDASSGKSGVLKKTRGGEKVQQKKNNDGDAKRTQPDPEKRRKCLRAGKGKDWGRGGRTAGTDRRTIPRKETHTVEVSFSKGRKCRLTIQRSVSGGGGERGGRREQQGKAGRKRRHNQ